MVDVDELKVQVVAVEETLVSSSCPAGPPAQAVKEFAAGYRCGLWGEEAGEAPSRAFLAGVDAGSRERIAVAWSRLRSC